MDPPYSRPLPPPPLYTPPPSHKQTKQTKLGAREQYILRKPKRTNPIVWFGAILCLLFSLLLIFFGVATLIIFVAIKPRYPVFDTPAASLSVIYFASPQFLNGDITFLANFSNPNRKLGVGYEYLYVELYFTESLIASQVLQPFSQQPGEVKVAPVHLLSSLVYLPPNLALELQKQEQRNRIVYNIKGTFRVKVKLGMVRYSYWLHAKCQLEMTSPPTGVLVRHSCTTKR